MKEKFLDIKSTILEVYKSLESPDFSFVQKCLDSNPYQNLINSLTSSYSIVENTDPNDDVCFSLELERNRYKWLLQLSMVGRFAACFRLNGEGNVVEVLSVVTGDLIDDELKLREVLSDYNVRLLTKSDMEEHIDLRLINTEPEEVCLYQVLFCDTDTYPWEVFG